MGYVDSACDDTKQGPILKAARVWLQHWYCTAERLQRK